MKFDSGWMLFGVILLVAVAVWYWGTPASDTPAAEAMEETPLLKAIDRLSLSGSNPQRVVTLAMYSSCTQPACRVTEGSLTEDWSPIYDLPLNYGPSLTVLDEGAVGMVRVWMNGNAYTYTVDHLGKVEYGFIMFRGFFADKVQVKAANAQSVGKRFTLDAARNKEKEDE